jgi:hypothetical protein
MLYFQLHSTVLRHHLGAKKICFKVDENGILIESVIIGLNKITPWALIKECDEKMDFSDTFPITEKAYKSSYEDANYIISQ